MNETSAFSLSSIERAVAILGAFDDQPELPLVEVARRAQLSEATALRYATSLTTHGFLERDADSGRYRLGVRLFELGQKALRRRDPRTIALPHMAALRDRFGETVNLAMRHGDDLVLIEVLESPRAIRKGAQLGDRDYWHASSLGKAVLAQLSRDDARALIERVERPRFTRNTITSAAQLLEHLDLVRTQGFAIDELESEEEIRCVGAAVLDRHGSPAYAISIAGPANRLTSAVAGEMGGAVREAAAAISAALGHLKPEPALVDSVEPREAAPA